MWGAWRSVGGAGRRIRGEPGFYAFVVLCLGLGIGMSTAVFTVADGILFRPLEFEDSHELVYAQATLSGPDGEVQRYLVSPANFVEMRERNGTLERLSATWSENYDLTGLPEPIRVVGVRSTPDLYETLGVSPFAGRRFREEDVGAPVAMVSEGLARRLVGEPSALVGTMLEVGGSSREIIGIVADDLAYPAGVELWTPYRPDDVGPAERHSGGLQVVGRLKTDMSIAAAGQDMERIAAELRDLYPANNGGRGIEIGELRTPFVEDSETGLVAVLAAVMVFLFATVANVTGLFMVRAGRRVRLLAVRTALGASRVRLVRDAVVEGLAIAGSACLLGIVLAAVLVPTLTESLAELPPGGAPAVGDARVLSFAVALLAITALVCSAAPALVAWRLAPAGVLRAGSRGATATRAQRRLQSVVVVGQAVLGVVLIVTATASVDRLMALLRVDPGFGAEPALTVRIPISEDRHPSFEERSRMALSLARTFAQIDGVEVAGGADVLPVGDPDVMYALSVETLPPDDPSSFELARGRLVTPGYLEAAGIRFVRGRTILDSDRADAPGVAVVSEAFAEKYWPGEDPIGMRVKRRTYDSPFPWLSVVGVVADVRDGGPATEIGPTWYLPYAQHDTRLGRELSYVIRSTRPTRSLLRDVRERLDRVDPVAPIVRIAGLGELQAEALAPERTAGRVMTGFAIGGLILLAMGIYGVMSRTVLERRRELGLRRVLGESRGGVIRHALRESLALVVSGLAGGLVLSPLLAEGARRVLGSEIQVPGWAYPLTVIVVFGAGALASLIPALRAARVSPLTALRAGSP